LLTPYILVLAEFYELLLDDNFWRLNPIPPYIIASRGANNADDIKVGEDKGIITPTKYSRSVMDIIDETIYDIIEDKNVHSIILSG